MARRPPGLTRAAVAVAIAVTLLVGCTQASPSPTASASGRTSASPGGASPSLSVSGSAHSSATASSSPSPTPLPLSLETPPRSDPHKVSVSVAPQVDAKVGSVGRITVTVRNAGSERIDELVLRWPTELGATLFLAPFQPSAARVTEGKPLVVPWTKWVEGPGEHGEPAGTTSLGWGPLMPNAELTIPLVATRRTAGSVAFDLQVLAGVPAAGEIPEGGDTLLTLAGGGPAQLRVEVP